MKPKTMLKFFWVILAGAAAILGCLYYSTVDIAKEEQMEKYLEKAEDGKPIRVLKTVEQNDFFCVLYESDNLDTLKIFKRSFFNRYKDWGGGSVLKNEIGVFQYEEGNDTALVILYADNTKMRADQCIVETKQGVSAVSIGDYLININQLALDDKNPSVTLEITKDNGNILCKIW